MSAPLGSLERALRVAVAVLALAVALLANVRAHAEEWSRAVVADEVAVTVVEVNAAELERLIGSRSSRDLGTSRRAPHGYAVLRRNNRTGAYSCTVYVPPAATAETLAHERRHCAGWVHP